MSFFEPAMRGDLDSLSEILHLGYLSKQNVLLTGEGGWGKSRAAELFANTYYSPGEIFVKSFNIESRMADILGGVDFRALKEEDRIKYNLDNSFLNARIVIFEELFDASPIILTGLKDILSAGGYREGNSFYPARYDFIIAITNHRLEEYADDRAVEALLQRFPLHLEVEYEYNPVDVLFSKQDIKQLKPMLFNDNTDDIKVLQNTVIEHLKNLVKPLNLPPRLLIASKKTALAACRYTSNVHQALTSLQYIYRFPKEKIGDIRDEIILHEQNNRINEIEEEFSEFASYSIKNYERAKEMLDLLEDITHAKLLDRAGQLKTEILEFKANCEKEFANKYLTKQRRRTNVEEI